MQVEVYYGRERPLTEAPHVVATKVCEELVEMGLIHGHEHIESVHTKWVRFANVIFDLDRRAALRTVLDWLESQGMAPDGDDLAPTTDWDTKLAGASATGQRIVLAGRYAQWKYYWTDDCVMRGAEVARRLGIDGQRASVQDRRDG